MYITLLLVIIMFALIPLYLRGGTLHNYLARKVGAFFYQVGFSIFYEHLIYLHNGRIDFVDLWVKRGNCQICIEIETSARNVIRNAVKAEQAYLPLWIVVPNKKVKKAVAKKLSQTTIRPGGLKIYILLLGQLEQTLRNNFPLITLANSP